jgi:F-type H+-transporting ATPase subunit b
MSADDMYAHQIYSVTLASEAEPSPLIPHTSELIVGIVAFALLYFFLARRVYPIFERTFAERTAAIEGGIERAEAAQAEAQRALEQYRAQLAEAHGEASKIRTDAQAERKAIVDEARAEAQAAAERVTERARAQIQSDLAQARTALSREVGALAVNLAGRIVGENLSDTERTQATVERFVADLERVSASGAASNPRPSADADDARGSHTVGPEPTGPR